MNETGTERDWPEKTFFFSPWRNAAYALLSLALAAGGGFIILHTWGDPASVRVIVGGWGGLLFFGLTTVWWTSRLFSRGPIVDVTRQGVRDHRISSAWIPWSTIRDVQVRTMRRSKFVVLDVDPALLDAMATTRFQKMLRGLSKSTGYQGIWLSAAGLSGTFAELQDAIEAGMTRESAGG